MKGNILFLLIVLFMSPALQAHAADLSKYPCTVFNADVCFRLPRGMSLDYSIPSDFHLYTVRKGGLAVATVYVGGAPQRIESDELLIKRKVPGWVLKMGAAKDGEVSETYILPKARSKSATHISLEAEVSDRAKVAELLSSFRPCYPVKSGGQRCPKDGVWSRELIGFMLRKSSNR
ncbi:hypothetical protein [Lysobacter sp. ESA13C]|uniref:hypothetical protein n=1 Tax=Lysobacter sp. ESA13C TaxID=2862676 RepID=UPI001CBCA066|nr:hypothetical protein [Lysobacter sp. ESA13C]